MRRFFSLLPAFFLFLFLTACDPVPEKDALPVYATFGKDDLQRKAIVKAHLDRLPNTLSKTVSSGKLSDFSVPQDNITLSKGYDDALRRPFIVTIYLSDFYKLDVPAPQQAALYNAASLKDIQQMADATYIKRLRPTLLDEELLRILYTDFKVIRADSIEISGKNVYETIMSFDVMGEKRKSYMYVFPYNDFLVMKVRISFVDSQSSVFDPFAAAFIKDLFSTLYR